MCSHSRTLPCKYAKLLGLRNGDGADEGLVQCLLPHAHGPFPKSQILRVLLLWGLPSNNHGAVSAMWFQWDWELRYHKSPLPLTELTLDSTRIRRKKPIQYSCENETGWGHKVEDSTVPFKILRPPGLNPSDY